MVWIIEDFSGHILVRLQAEVVETRETRGAEAKSVTTAQALCSGNVADIHATVPEKLDYCTLETVALNVF